MKCTFPVNKEDKNNVLQQEANRGKQTQDNFFARTHYEDIFMEVNNTWKTDLRTND